MVNPMHFLARIANRRAAAALRQDLHDQRRSLALWRARERSARRALAGIGGGDDEALAREMNRAGAVSAAGKVLGRQRLVDVLDGLLHVLERQLLAVVRALRLVLQALWAPAAPASVLTPTCDPLAREHAAHGPPAEPLTPLLPRAAIA